MKAHNKLKIRARTIELKFENAAFYTNILYSNRKNVALLLWFAKFTRPRLKGKATGRNSMSHSLVKLRVLSHAYCLVYGTYSFNWATIYFNYCNFIYLVGYLESIYHFSLSHYKAI